MSKIVLGIFYDRSQAENAIIDLENKGYNTKDFSILMRDRQTPQTSEGLDEVVGQTASGVLGGGILGSLAGLVASYFIPGLGAFFVGGPIAASLGLAGVAAEVASGVVTGAAAGGVIGALTGLGASEREARIYQENIDQGGILLAVPARFGEEDEVRSIMRNYGAGQVRSIESLETIIRPDQGELATTPAYFSELKKRPERKR